MTTIVDAVVIGGGIVGASSAAHLAADGRSVMLLERAAIAAGASGRNSGVVQHPFDPDLVRWHLETVELYRTLGPRAETAFRLGERPVGLLSIGPDADAVRHETAAWAAHYPGLGPTFLSADEVRRLEPSIAPGLAACRLEIGYPVAPDAATRAYAAWASTLGVIIEVGRRARPWLEQGRVRGVIVDDGTRVAARDVVVAAGPWSPAVIDPSGGWRPIRPLWGVVVAVELDGGPTHVLEELGIKIEPDDADRDEDEDGTDPGLSFSLVPGVRGHALGSTFLPDEPDPDVLVPTVVARGRSFVPGIADARLGAHRVCARPASLDGRPLVGRVAGTDGLWIAAGHGPWGVSIGPATGRLLADLIAGRVATPPPALDPARFGQPALART